MASEKGKKGEEKFCRRTGATLYGRFAGVFVYKDAIEVRTTSTFLLIAVLWLSAGLVFGLTLFFFMSFWLSLLITLAGGILGYWLFQKYYKGRLDRRMEFKDIVSFVRDPSDFVVNLKDNYMYSIRMNETKQEQVLLDIAEALQDNEEIRVVRIGEYYKLYPVEKEKEEQPAVRPSARKKKKALPAPQTPPDTVAGGEEKPGEE